MADERDHLTDEAAQFLLVAGATVAVATGAITLAAWLVPGTPTTPVEQVLAHQHAGYILRDVAQVIGNAWPLVARISAAVVLSVAVGGVLGTALQVMPGLRTQAWRAGRWTMLGVLLWSLFAVLFLPPRSLKVTREGLQLLERPAVLGQVSLPVPARARSYGRAEVSGIAAHLGPAGDTLRLTFSDGGREDLLLPHQEAAGSAFVASALHDHLTHP